jgi:hypothetical protein
MCQKETMMWQRTMRQRELFDDGKRLHVPELQEEVQQEATRLLVQWMAALAKAIDMEAGNEQDQR